MNGANRFSRFLISATALVYTMDAFAADFAPPTITVVDKFGVNMVNGQVSQSLNTVAIGRGGMGLSHSISTWTNDFLMKGWKGYRDKYEARTRYEVVKQDNSELLDAVSIHDDSDSVRFMVLVDGQRVSAKSSITSNYTYLSIGDLRHTLVVNGNYLDWTKPDGTLVKFKRSSTLPAGEAVLAQIIYPNGFTITMSASGATNFGVTTNTGFQLKYDYPVDTRPLDKSDIYGAWIPTSSPASWSGFNPKTIRAVNLALDNCSAYLASCTLDWPKVTFNWPAGMARSIYIGESIFSVVDADGGVTEYHFKSYDLAYTADQTNPQTTVVPPYVPNTRFSPRLVGVKPAGSDQITLRYSYKNNFSSTGFSSGLWGGTMDTLADEAGLITTASNIDRVSGYNMGQAYYSDFENFGSSIGGVTSVKMRRSVPGTVSAVDSLQEGTTYYEGTFRNFPIQQWTKDGVGGAFREFEYDARGNLKSITANRNQVMTAEYPACDANNTKYCNKPIWISDWSAVGTVGNKTNYTYHAPSGQVETVTYPANPAGLIAQTRYGYEQKTANYYRDNGVKSLGSPIWLKTSESACVNSNYSNGACVAADEVMTRYEYNHDNLLLTGMTVSSQKDNKTLRTCYQYDIYGNQIGVTKPNANLPACN